MQSILIRYSVFSFPDAEFLHIKLDAVDIRYLVSSFQMLNFYILGTCQKLAGGEGGEILNLGSEIR